MPARLPEFAALLLGLAACLALVLAGRQVAAEGAAGELALEAAADELAARIDARWRAELDEPRALALAEGARAVWRVGEAQVERVDAQADATLRALLMDVTRAVEAADFERAARTLEAADEFAPGAAERARVWLERLRLARARGDRTGLRATLFGASPDWSGAEADGGFSTLGLGVLLAAEVPGAFEAAELRELLDGRWAAVLGTLPEPRFELEDGVARSSVAATVALARLESAVGGPTPAAAAAFEQLRAHALISAAGVEPPDAVPARPGLRVGPDGALRVAPVEAGRAEFSAPDLGIVEVGLVALERIAEWVEQEAASSAAGAAGFAARIGAPAPDAIGRARSLGEAELEFTIRHADRAGFVAAENRRAGGLRRVLWALGVFALFTGAASCFALRRQRLLAEAQTRFVASVSHELRTPVTAIRLIAENLSAGPSAPERVARYAGLLDAESRRLGALVEGVLDTARLQRGELLGVRPEDVAGGAYAEALAAEVRARCAAAGLQVELRLEALEALEEPAQFDPEAVRRAVLNLVDNAVLHSGGARVELRVQRAGSQLAFAVRDDGRGVPAAQRARLLRPFERGAAADGSVAKGTGLGLAIAAAVAREHGGRLELGAAALGGLEARLVLLGAAPQASGSSVTTPHTKAV